MTISPSEKRGLLQAGSNTSAYNALMFAIGEYLNEYLSTAWVGRVDSTTTESEGGADRVDVTPMVSQSNAEGDSLPSVSIPAIPHTRFQHGIAAIIINPVPGDIVACVSCKQDISNVNADSAKPERAGSYRGFSQSDSVAVGGSVLTKAPQVFIELKQDKTIFVKAPAGYTLETDGTVRINAPRVEISGDLVVTGEVTGKGVNLSTHTHGGVRGGDSHTDVPDK